jgi:hypothetical protein
MKQDRAFLLAQSVGRLNRCVINPVMRPLAGHLPADALEVASTLGRCLRRALATSTVYARLEAI